MERNNKYQGLLRGNGGIAIFFYNLAKKTSDKKYLKYADSLVDEIYKRLGFSLNFSEGLAGTGWCIEYLIQNNFCKGNADKILQVIDTKIFKFLNEQKDFSFDFQSGLIGYLQYFTIRLKNKKNYKNYETQINTELFKFIINEIDRMASPQFINLTKDIKFDLLNDIYMLLWSLNDAFTLNIYREKIINMLKQWETYLLSYLPCLHINRLYLATVLFQTNRFLKSEKVNKHIETLLFSIDTNLLESEIDIKKINNLQLGYFGFLFILSLSINNFNFTYPNYQQLLDFKRIITFKYNNKLFDELKEIRKDVKNIFSTQYGIIDGWAGVGLLLLHFPDLLESK